MLGMSMTKLISTIQGRIAELEQDAKSPFMESSYYECIDAKIDELEMLLRLIAE